MDTGLTVKTPGRGARWQRCCSRLTEKSQHPPSPVASWSLSLFGPGMFPKCSRVESMVANADGSEVGALGNDWILKDPINTWWINPLIAERTSGKWDLDGRSGSLEAALEGLIPPPPSLPRSLSESFCSPCPVLGRSPATPSAVRFLQWCQPTMDRDLWNCEPK